jgi:hypothetical protein
MKVSELIEKLKEFPEDLEVLPGSDYDNYPILNISVEINKMPEVIINIDIKMDHVFDRLEMYAP